jgi:hypothetical protein
MTTEVKKPEAFNFFGVDVYNADELKEYDPYFFLGCSRGIRKIVDKKSIPNTEYYYGSASKSGWKKCTSIYPKAKLLLKADWVHDNVPKMAMNKDVLYDVEPAPPILELEDHEKFKDEHGKVLEIEVRGERDPKNCYFKVSDVSREFGMDRLHNTIIDQHRDGYMESMHYKYFTCMDNKSLKKSIYLTYHGLSKVITSTRCKFVQHNSRIISVWMHGVVTYDHKQPYILQHIDVDRSGMIYVVTSPIFNAVKIGLWSGHIKGLESRYRMAYGQDIQMVTKNVRDVVTAEKDIHKHFDDKCLSGELFDKKYIKEYITFLYKYT